MEVPESMSDRGLDSSSRDMIENNQQDVMESNQQATLEALREQAQREEAFKAEILHAKFQRALQHQEAIGRVLNEKLFKEFQAAQESIRMQTVLYQQTVQKAMNDRLRQAKRKDKTRRKNWKYLLRKHKVSDLETILRDLERLDHLNELDQTDEICKELQQELEYSDRLLNSMTNNYCIKARQNLLSIRGTLGENFSSESLSIDENGKDASPEIDQSTKRQNSNQFRSSINVEHADSLRMREVDMLSRELDKIFDEPSDCLEKWLNLVRQSEEVKQISNMNQSEHFVPSYSSQLFSPLPEAKQATAQSCPLPQYSQNCFDTQAQCFQPSNQASNYNLMLPGNYAEQSCPNGLDSEVAPIYYGHVQSPVPNAYQAHYCPSVMPENFLPANYYQSVNPQPVLTRQSWEASFVPPQCSPSFHQQQHVVQPQKPHSIPILNAENSYIILEAPCSVPVTKQQPAVKSQPSLGHNSAPSKDQPHPGNLSQQKVKTPQQPLYLPKGRPNTSPQMAASCQKFSFLNRLLSEGQQLQVPNVCPNKSSSSACSSTPPTAQPQPKKTVPLNECDPKKAERSYPPPAREKKFRPFHPVPPKMELSAESITEKISEYLRHLPQMIVALKAQVESSRKS